MVKYWYPICFYIRSVIFLKLIANIWKTWVFFASTESNLSWGKGRSRVLFVIRRTMSFIGTQQKCKACEKTVYPVELLSADGVNYHKSCFKCSHCKGTLKVLLLCLYKLQSGFHFMMFAFCAYSISLKVVKLEKE